MRPEIKEWLDQSIKEAHEAIAKAPGKHVRLWDAVPYKMVATRGKWGLTLWCHHAWTGGNNEMFLTEKEAFEAARYFLRHKPAAWHEINKKPIGEPQRFKHWLGALKYAVSKSKDLFGKKEYWLERTYIVPDKALTAMDDRHVVYITKGGNIWIARRFDQHYKCYNLITD